jgi:hypothetical protein
MNHDKEVQLVFDKVIKAGLYIPTDSCSDTSKNYMCNSLKQAFNVGVITFDELVLARSSIRAYLDSPLQTLYSFLKTHHYPTEAKTRLAVYTNWAKRPRF